MIAHVRSLRTLSLTLAAAMAAACNEPGATGGGAGDTTPAPDAIADDTPDVVDAGGGDAGGGGVDTTPDALAEPDADAADDAAQPDEAPPDTRPDLPEEDTATDDTSGPDLVDGPPDESVEDTEDARAGDEETEDLPDDDDVAEDADVTEDTVDTGIDTVDTGIDTVDTGIDTVDTGIDTVDTGIDTVDTGIDTVDTGIDTVDTGIDTVDTGIDTVDTGIDTVDTGIDTVDTGIDTVDTGIDTVDTGIDTVDTGIDTVDTGIDTVPDDRGGAAPPPAPVDICGEACTRCGVEACLLDGPVRMAISETTPGPSALSNGVDLLPGASLDAWIALGLGAPDVDCGSDARLDGAVRRWFAYAVAGCARVDVACEVTLAHDFAGAWAGPGVFVLSSGETLRTCCEGFHFEGATPAMAVASCSVVSVAPGPVCAFVTAGVDASLASVEAAVAAEAEAVWSIPSCR